MNAEEAEGGPAPSVGRPSPDSGPDRPHAAPTRETPQARSPAALAPRNWWRVAKRVAATAGRENFTLIAAGVAFYALLSVAPAVAALATLYGLIADPADIRGQLELLRDVAPPAAFDAVLTQVAALDQARPTTLGWASAIAAALALLTARAGVQALNTGIAVAYRQPGGRGFVLDFVVSYLLTFGLVLVAGVAIGAVVIAPAAVALLPLGSFAETVTAALRWPLSLVAIMAALGALYRYAPARREARMGWVTPGAVAATALWLLGSAAFSAYVARFQDYNETYGALGAVAALLTWFWLSALAALVGAALNAELELETAADTTVGPDKPMGQRGAYVADHVAG